MTDTLTAPARPPVGTVPIELRDVSIRFERPGEDPLSIVDDFSLRIQTGRMHCLAGRSGSGKTSILRVAAGLVPPTSGEVLWAEEPITGWSDDRITARRRTTIGYMDQGGVLVPGLTAMENVLLPAVPDRHARRLTRTASALLELLGVAGRETSFPDRLSGGERQRVAFARALLLGPSTIMCDEPTASLDRATADAVIGILRDLTHRGIAVLVASHDQRLIDEADSITRLA